MTSCIIRENGDLGNNSEDGGGKEGGGEEERFVERSLMILLQESIIRLIEKYIFFSLSLSRPESIPLSIAFMNGERNEERIRNVDPIAAEIRIKDSPNLT